MIGAGNDRISCRLENAKCLGVSWRAYGILGSRASKGKMKTWIDHV